jgi:hypothetical protein
MAVKKKKRSRSEQAAIKYAGYHEFVCGSSVAHHFEEGFKRGWAAASATAKRRQKKIEKANSDEDRITAPYR